MIVVNSRAGQRSNRLFTIAQAMGVAIDRKELLRLTAFGNYAKDYRCQSPDDVAIKIRDSRIWEFVRLAIACVKRMFPRFKISIPYVLTVVSDWTFQRHGVMARHQDAIRAFFTPVSIPEFKKSKDEIVIAVHKRLGDYLYWMGGRYFYSEEVYRRIMDNVRLLFSRPIRFEVFSNENSMRSAVEDQYLMSQCDYIVGPPSTFSLWASFMGKVPIAVVSNPDQVLTLSDFTCEWK